MPLENIKEKKEMKKLFYLGALLLIISLTACTSKINDVEEIKKAGVISLATNATFAPFESVDGDTFTGIDIDIALAYSNYLGVKLNIKDQDFDAILPSISTGKADFAMAGITKTPKREESVAFSKPYFVASQVVIVKKGSSFNEATSQDELLNLLSNNKAKLGCQRGTTGEAFIAGSSDMDFAGITNATCVSYDDGIMAAKALENGQLDGVVIDKAVAELLITNYADLVVIPYTLTEEEYAIAVNKANKELLASLNNFIDIISNDGTLDTIIGKYYEVK